MEEVAGTLPVFTQLAYRGAQKTGRYGYIDGLSINNPASDRITVGWCERPTPWDDLTPRRQW